MGEGSAAGEAIERVADAKGPISPRSFGDEDGPNTQKEGRRVLAGENAVNEARERLGESPHHQRVRRGLEERLEEGVRPAGGTRSRARWKTGNQ